MVREFTELQGTMGGIYARAEGLPEEIWKAIYYHYLPVGVEADAPPSRAQLGKAAVTWAAVSLADKLDTIVGLFAAGEKPTGSRDPYGLRRAAQGVIKILVDLPNHGVPAAERFDLPSAVQQAFNPYAIGTGLERDDWSKLGLDAFFWERLSHLLERRGYKADEIRVVGSLPAAWANPFEAIQRVDAIARGRAAPDFQALAALFKRAKNITRGLNDEGIDIEAQRSILREPAEIALTDELLKRWPEIQASINGRRLPDAIRLLSQLNKPVDRFFTDVLVMAEEPELRKARLGLLIRLRSAVLNFFGDISEIVPDEQRQA
jgi:glycyl-tRNA synthetase beta chain